MRMTEMRMTEMRMTEMRMTEMRMTYIWCLLYGAYCKLFFKPLHF